MGQVPTTSPCEYFLRLAPATRPLSNSHERTTTDNLLYLLPGIDFLREFKQV